MKEDKKKRKLSRKSRGLIVLGLGLIPLALLGVYTYIPGASNTKAVSLSLIISFVVFMVLAFAYAVELGISVALGVIRVLARPLRSSKARVSELERDYTWRKVKVGYIILAAIVVAAVTGAAYNSTVSEPPYYEPSADAAWSALIVGVVIVWLVYRFVLTRVYRYLAKPRDDNQG